MPKSVNRIPVELPRPLYTELREQAQREGRPLTSVLVDLVYTGKRQTVQPSQGAVTHGR